MHDDVHPQSSSPQKSLSLCNPASGSHSQASPDPLNPAAPDLSDGHMHGSPRNPLEDEETTENTGNSSGRRDGWNVLDSQNFPSPGSQRGPEDDSLFHGGVRSLTVPAGRCCCALTASIPNDGCGRSSQFTDVHD